MENNINYSGCIWYPVTEIDSDGDVIFCYNGIFGRFKLLLYIPPIGYGQDPNTWKSQEIDSRDSAIRARKLWVPRRYQWWSILTVGKHIGKYLFLVAHASSKA